MIKRNYQRQFDDLCEYEADDIVNDEGDDSSDEAVFKRAGINVFQSTMQNGNDLDDVVPITCSPDTLYVSKRSSDQITVLVRNLSGEVIYGPTAYEIATFINVLKYDTGPFLSTTSAYFDLCHDGCILDPAITLGAIPHFQDLEFLAIRRSKYIEYKNAQSTEEEKHQVDICTQDDEEMVEDLLDEEVSRDNLLGAEIRNLIRGKWFSGIIESIHVGIQSGERLYLIRYEDRDVEHMTRPEVVMLLI